jgi:isocitrate dehydrogenase (NAD+)
MKSVVSNLARSSKRALSTHVTMIPGDGIGPEVMAVTKEVVAATGAPIIWDEKPLSEIQGYTASDYHACLDSLKENKVCLKGFMLAGRKHDINEKRTLAMQMRQDLGAFASVVHVKTFDGVQTKYKNLDFIVIRETTEGEYCGEEHEIDTKHGKVVEGLKVTTLEKTERIAKFAFDYALKHGRKKITCVHKANIMKQGDGLFMRTCAEIAKQYPTIEYQDMIVDNTCMQLVSNPYQFDILLTPNLYGNIVSNLGAGLMGGAGVLAGSSYSNDIAFFEAGARYTFQSGAGQDICNPTAMFMSAGNMLYHLGLGQYGGAIKQAVRKVLKSGKIRTKDIGGHHSCSQFTAEVINKMKPVEQAEAYKVVQN